MWKKILPVLILFVMSYRVAAQVDTLPPVLVCRTDFTTYATPFFCYGTLYASDLIDTVYDNQPAGLPLELGIRKACLGSGFPSTQEITVYEWGGVAVELWARDAAGNTAGCTLSFFSYDGTQGCDPAWNVAAQDRNGNGLKNVSMHIFGTHCVGDTVDFTVVTGNSPGGGYSGSYGHWGFLVPNEGYALRVTPQKTDNPLNGITSYDLVLIQKHVLGLQPFTAPWQFLAADVNQDNKVTTYDIVLLSRLILGLDAALPGGHSWRFWPEGYVFPNPDNPLNPPAPVAYFNPLAVPIPSLVEFTGVKLGDVNGSAIPEN